MNAGSRLGCISFKANARPSGIVISKLLSYSPGKLRAVLLNP
jgi:hypothetical protein